MPDANPLASTPLKDLADEILRRGPGAALAMSARLRLAAGRRAEKIDPVERVREFIFSGDAWVSLAQIRQSLRGPEFAGDALHGFVEQAVAGGCISYRKTRTKAGRTKQEFCPFWAAGD